MKRPHRTKRNLPRQSNGTDITIWLLHQAMATKLLANPLQLIPIQQRLEQRYQAGQIKHSGYIHWHCILAAIDKPELFRRELLDKGERMTKLRRRTILVGLLSEPERAAIVYRTEPDIRVQPVANQPQCTQPDGDE
ncbi:hypothetical protein [Arsukibacterium sp.]|uniref:hypothetical protein n=1 Tax=Arsukibacterium sp. TaxID=1977258 RepID=UPI002FDB7AA2